MWYESVATQNDRRFDLWIGLDGIVGPSEAAALGGIADPHWVIGMPGESPAALRGRAIALLALRYPAIVFVDSDDVLLSGRVEAARAALEKHDVVGCALNIVDEDGKDLGVRFGPPAGTEWAELLPRHNVFGLSNSAYRSDVLRRLLPLPETCILIDWLFATRAWALGYDMYFDEEPGMSYRQYGENVAKVLPPFTSTDVLRATERVRKHYDLLLDEPSWPMPASSLSPLMAARKRFTAFERFVLESPTGPARYVEALNALPPCFVWWWAVANPELEQIWMK